MRTLIAIPAMDQMHSWTAQCLMNLRQTGECRTDFVIRAPVDKARNTLALRAVREGFDRVLWIDSDMVFGPDLMERLSADMDEGWDIVTGLYFLRAMPTAPVIYKSVTAEPPAAEAYADYPADALFPVAGCGFGGVLVRTEVFAEMTEPPFRQFPHMSEDLSFCVRAKGRKMACDSRVKLGHLGCMVYGEEMYRR